MRVKLNLAVSPSRRERYAFAWTVPLALVALAGLAFLCRTTAREFTEYRKVHRERVRLQDQENALLKSEGDLVKDFERPDFRGVSHQAQFVNALIEKKRLTLTELTEKVAKVLPPSVHLTSLSFSRQEGGRVVHLVVSSRSETALENFLTNLENSADFKDVVLSQGFEQASGATGPPTIACTARYVGGE